MSRPPLAPGPFFTVAQPYTYSTVSSFMLQAPDPSASGPSLQAENAALREENRQLCDRLAAAPEAAEQTRYEQSQARFRTVFENAPLGQKIITPDLTIRQANQAVVAMLGYARVEDIVGHKICIVPR